MRPALNTLLPALAISLALAACGSSSKSTSSSPPSSSSTSASSSATTTTSTSAGAQAVKTASNSQLGATVLVDARGMTLYHLSGEQHGKFICKSAGCEKNWPPVAASATNTAISGLETVKRPDGSEQLAYRGEPLYTFAGDRAPGEANGQGVKDGAHTWSAVVASASGASTGQSTSASQPASSGASKPYR